MSDAFRYQLGSLARDRVTGFAGIIVSRSEHLFGCARYWIEPQELKDGKRIEGAWFDEDALEIVKTGVIEAKRYRVVEAAVTHGRVERRSGGPSDQPAATTHSTGRP